jgi:eukaryotic-like serine/threonine-protein kinase
MSTDSPAGAVLGAGDPLVGTSYHTRSYLGQGSFGLVLEAEHVALGTVVVVKLLHKNLAMHPGLVDRLRLEAQAMSRLRSPHLTLCTDFSTTFEGQPFLVLERLYGRTVAEELSARGALPVEEAVDVARQTLAGLAVVHDAGIVHRDIKAANLFLCPREGGGRLVKILDFGVAKVVASSSDGPRPLVFPTEEGTAVGSPRCFSPEQARGQPVDARTDVYAVGLLLYTLLTGRGPFDDVSGVLALINAHVARIPEPPSARARQPIPPELDAAVMRALSKAKDDRFPSARDFAAALALVPVVHPLVPSAYTEPLGAEGTRRARSRDVETLLLPRRGAAVVPPDLAGWRATRAVWMSTLLALVALVAVVLAMALAGAGPFRAAW